MTNIVSTTFPDRFDCSAVDTNIADEMRETANRVQSLIRASVVDVGRELLAIKARLDHGQFTAWVERECQVNIRTAQRAMQAADMINKTTSCRICPPMRLRACRAIDAGTGSGGAIDAN